MRTGLRGGSLPFFCRSCLYQTILRGGVMLPLTGLIPTLHRIVLFTFVGVTSVSMLVAVVRRLRLRRPLLVWRRSGPFSFTRLPLGPLLFLVLVAGGFGHAWLMGRSVTLPLLIGYPAGGMFWFVATWVFQTVLVTEYGIVDDVSRVHRAVVWSQIVDYFVAPRDGEVRFVFFYRDSSGNRRRLDLPVPEKHASVFHKIVKRKLRPRLSVSGKEDRDEEMLDRLDDQIDLS